MPTPPRPRLADLRRARGCSQRDVAAVLQVGAENVSTLERRDDPRLSSVIRYVQALGGELELHARFGETRVPIAYQRGKAARQGT